MKNNTFSNLFNWIVFLPVIGIVITSFALTNIYIDSMYKAYEYEVVELEKKHLNNVKERIKNRINNVSSMIDKNYNFQLNESKQMARHYVNLGHSILNAVYQNNKNKSKKEIYKIINKQMKDIRFLDNKSGYFFIYDAKDAISISLPSSPSLVGKSLINLEDKNKKNLFYSYQQVMKKTSEGFDTWYWNKPNSKIKSKKIGYVKLFKPLNIVIGTAIYEDDIKDLITKNTIKILEELKFQDNAYIFILNKNGTPLLHKNQEIIDVPLEKLSQTTQKNVTNILNQAKLKKRTFLEYKQDEKLFTDFKVSKKISYVQYIQKLNWIIGTGLYTDDLNFKIKEKKFLLEKRLNENINLIIAISIVLSLGILFIIMFVSRKIKKTLIYYSDELDNKNNELQKMNFDLEETINKQVNILREKDLILNQQSKVIAVGEMFGNIAHQWRQPLSAISTLASGIRVRKEFNLISEEEIDKDLHNIVNTTQVLSQTIDDFRDFYSNKKEKVEFEIENVIEQVLNLILSNLKSKNITVEKNIQKIKCNTYKNELLQVLLNIINNAKDALLKVQTQRYIFIGVKQIDNNMIIEIYDNAGGINNGIIEKVFEPYFTTKGKSQGTGIGLYMSKNIIETSLNSKISVENFNFNYNNNTYIGAKFILTIPNKH
jgi:signal transduction histidine kinase